MTGPTDFAKMVPGFDFLQNLMKGAGAGLPQINQWIAPTLDPVELDKRIQDLKTVQFWLEQNSRLLGTTIQALEVQRMTLSTLKSMNLPLADLGAALRMPEPAAAAPSPAPIAEPAPAPTPVPPAGPQPATQAAPAAVDPMQWWGALTQQFGEIAAQALKNNPVDNLRQATGTTATRSRSAKAASGKASEGPAGQAASRKTVAKRGRATAKPATAAKRSRG